MKRSLAFLIVLLFSCTHEHNSEIVLLDVDSFNKAIEAENINLIDVRTKEEFDEGSIPNAMNIDFKKDDFMSQFESFNKQEEIYLFCRSGGRSASAAKKLKDAGFVKIYDLEGGYLEWSKR